MYAEDQDRDRKQKAKNTVRALSAMLIAQQTICRHIIFYYLSSVSLKANLGRYNKVSHLTIKHVKMAVHRDFASCAMRLHALGRRNRFRILLADDKTGFFS